MKTFETVTRRLAGLAIAAIALAFPVALSAQGNLPPAQVYARAYNGWNIIGQQANTYTFNGGVCSYAPYNNGNSPSFFVFSGLQGTTTVYNPVLITDASASLSEIVTPTATTQSTASCGAALAATNSHTSFVLSSGTAGLQEAVTNQVQSGPPSSVLLDQYWYNTIYALPGAATSTPETVIKAIKGSPNVQIIDTTTSPWTYWRSNAGGTAYTAATTLTGGTSAPTAAAGAAAGTSPTGPTNTGDGNTFTVALTTGSATTTGVLFTETWATTNAFLFPPSCRVISTPGATNPFTTFTSAVTFTSSAAKVTVTVTATPVAATAYAFTVTCN